MQIRVADGLRLAILFRRARSFGASIRVLGLVRLTRLGIVCTFRQTQAAFP